MFDFSSLGIGEDSYSLLIKYLQSFIPTQTSAYSSCPLLSMGVNAQLELHGKPYYFNKNTGLLIDEAKGSSINTVQCQNFPILIKLNSTTWEEYTSSESTEDITTISSAYNRLINALDIPYLMDTKDYFLSPLVIKGLAILPVNPAYITQFLPQIHLDNEDDGWNTFLIAQDIFNNYGTFIYKSITASSNLHRIPYIDRDKKNCFLSLSRPSLKNISNTDAPLVIVQSENRVFVILIPYHKKQPESQHKSFTSFGSNRSYLNEGIHTVGDSMIQIGQSHGLETMYGSKVAAKEGYIPIYQGQPFILELHILTSHKSSS